MGVVGAHAPSLFSGDPLTSPVLLYGSCTCGFYIAPGFLLLMLAHVQGPASGRMLSARSAPPAACNSHSHSTTPPTALRQRRHGLWY